MCNNFMQKRHSLCGYFTFSIADLLLWNGLSNRDVILCSGYKCLGCFLIIRLKSDIFHLSGAIYMIYLTSSVKINGTLLGPTFLDLLNTQDKRQGGYHKCTIVSLCQEVPILCLFLCSRRGYQCY